VLSGDPPLAELSMVSNGIVPSRSSSIQERAYSSARRQWSVTHLLLTTSKYL
jgi:hypothetical protein